MNERDDTLLKQIKYYLEKQTVVHIEYKSGRFYNGKIKELFTDSFILVDRKLGDIVIYFEFISVIEPFMEGGRYGN